VERPRVNEDIYNRRKVMVAKRGEQYEDFKGYKDDGVTHISCGEYAADFKDGEIIREYTNESNDTCPAAAF
jgi:hypothetical protein